MKKFIPVILAFVLVLIMLPVQNARADYNDGCPCPVEGCDGKLKVAWYNNQEHRYHCTECDFVAAQDHLGGKATCEKGPVCQECNGEYGDPLGHDFQRWPGHETITRMYFLCTRCDAYTWEHNSDTWNMKWEFVRYANGEKVNYEAHSTGPDYAGVLTVIPTDETERAKTDEIGLYLTPDDVYVWTWEMENRVELVRGNAMLAFDVRDVTPEMFGLKEEQQPDYYIFSLTPSGDGWLVKAEALMGEEKIPAKELKNVTLTLKGEEIEIPANGVYKAE